MSCTPSKLGLVGKGKIIVGIMCVCDNVSNFIYFSL